MRWMTVIGLGWAGLMQAVAGAMGPVVVGNLAALGLRDGGEVVGRVVEVSESHVHVVSAGLNRRIGLEALDEETRGRLGVGRVGGGAGAAVPRPGEPGGLTATRERLRQALERQEDWGWGVRPVRRYGYGYVYDGHGWGCGWPAGVSVLRLGWGGHSIRIRVDF